jgi:aspartate ammonia-lyase
MSREKVLKEIDDYAIKQKEILEQQRSIAKENLKKLEKLMEGQQDMEFICFINNVVESYMMNVCRLCR